MSPRGIRRDAERGCGTAGGDVKTDAVFSLHFHSLKGRFGFGIREVADFNAPGFTAVDAIVLYFQSTVIFPSWTSSGRLLEISYCRKFRESLPPGLVS